MAPKKKRSILKSIVLIIAAFAFISVAAWYMLSYFFKPPQIKYPAFGIHIPPGYAIHGIDVSRYQRIINWSEVKRMEVENIRIGFAFIKATEGIGRIDAQFRRNWLQSKEEKIPAGAYHFFVAGESGKAQAQNFIDIVKLSPGDLPPVLDIEKINGTGIDKLRKEALIWLNKIEKYYHVKPIIYTNVVFYNNYLNDGFEDYPVWIAHYLQASQPRTDHEWIFWQHSEQGHVNGIRAAVDFNIFNGDSTDFNELLIKDNSLAE